MNVLARQHYEKLALQDIPTLQNTNIRIYPYGSKHPFPILGKLDTFVAFEGKSANVPFYVINGNHQSLLSYATAQELGLIKIAHCSVNTTSAEQETPIDYCQLMEEYSDIFTGIGKLKDASIDIHVDETVTPVVQPHRRVPFSIRKQIEKELQHLEDAGIIEDTDGPTPWAPSMCSQTTKT